ncbi:MAG: hypothetical protein HYY06_25585, partial [Deltaproteobacteria bacterium]|nr:hypothetical protein [Deltaproteobacteria bacterium]
MLRAVSLAALLFSIGCGGGEREPRGDERSGSSGRLARSRKATTGARTEARPEKASQAVREPPPP